MRVPLVLAPQPFHLMPQRQTTPLTIFFFDTTKKMSHGSRKELQQLSVAWPYGHEHTPGAMPHECGNRATSAQASEALNVRSDAREDSQSRGASGQDPRESGQRTPGQTQARQSAPHA